MMRRLYALFGVVGPLMAYTSIGVSIALSPWFSWKRNALSDLGHSLKSEVAPIFNLGLLLAGFLIMMYSVTTFKKHARYTSISLTSTAFCIQLIATFDEVYGFLHFAVSVLLYTSIGISSIIYAIERKSSLAFSTFIIGLCSWTLYGLKIYSAGIAVPETISSIAVTSWTIYSAIKILISNNRRV